MSYPSFYFWKAEATAVPGKTAQLWKNGIYILLWTARINIPKVKYALSKLKSWSLDYFWFLEDEEEVDEEDEEDEEEEEQEELTFSGVHAPLETALFFCCWPRSHSCRSWKGHTDTLVNYEALFGWCDTKKQW